MEWLRGKIEHSKIRQGHFCISLGASMRLWAKAIANADHVNNRRLTSVSNG